MRGEGDGQAARFSNGGRGVGIVGLVGVGIFLAYGALDGDARFAPWGYTLCLFVGVAIWVVLVRPTLRVEDGVLELRNMLHSRWIPLARVTDVNITQVTAVEADGRRFVGSGVSRTPRQIRRDALRGGEGRAQDQSYGWVVQHRLRRMAEDARDLTAEEPPATRRTWAWPEIVALVGLALATVVLWLA
ncbi:MULTISPECIES: hypothetical protein [Nocardioides]|uniref:PH domain-containing protein n=1 Tax=Nocardioides vastitatis TaxID=2568655 RepID=A0ABW0Z9Q0_9ACTN|nr:hypothetical protein [Nocardioides sp.]THJ10517.1 hypothetical protein E7Z54_02885 [Nocardioides sp.]